MRGIQKNLPRFRKNVGDFSENVGLFSAFVGDFSKVLRRYIVILATFAPPLLMHRFSDRLVLQEVTSSTSKKQSPHPNKLGCGLFLRLFVSVKNQDS